MWNRHTKDVVKLMVPPVMLHDEIRTDGYGMALIDLLEHVGMLQKSVINGRTRWNACDDYKVKTVYLCLDGLSVDRHRCFFRKIVDLPLSFTDEFMQAIEFRKVLTRVIELSGPLHMSFHMLQSIYIIYGSLLSVGQTCLEWKKLKPAKVSDNYRLCCSLAFIVYEEITRLLMFQYMSQLQPEFVNSYDHNDPIKAIVLARGLLKFIEEKADNTLDMSVAYICRYWILMNRFKIYYDAQKCGDVLAMEVVENDFCGVFHLLGKKNYYELCLSQTERRYRDATYGELQEVRYNSSCRYRKDTNSNVYTMHVLDELMENVNYWTKCLPLGNDQDSWVKHSPNVMVARRCLNFVNNEYRRGLLDFESAIESDSTPVQNNQQYTTYVEPKCTLERSRLFELIVDLFNDEIDGRQFNIKQIESKIEKLTTTLKRNEPQTIPSALEQVINSINDLNTHIDGQSIMDNDVDDGIDVTVNDPPIDDDNDNTSVLHDDNEEEVEDGIELHDDLTNDSINTQSDCHRLSLIDVIHHGKDKMDSLNIDVKRKNMTILRECHDNFLFESFTTILNESNETDNFPSDDINTIPTSISSFILDFYHTKKENSSNDIGYVESFNSLMRR